MIRKLGVVDQSPVSRGSTPQQALRNSIDLAQQTEAFGYSRYWLAEHHSSTALAGSAPEILWRMLHALFPDRIDLGLGRAPGSDQTTAAALAKGPGALSSEHYPAQVLELASFLCDRPKPEGPFRDVRACPIVEGQPDLFLLSSSPGSASIAAHLGMPLVWAHFIAQQPGQDIVESYRQNYQPSELFPEPIVMLATTAIAADTEQEAAFVASSVQRWRSSGLQGPIPEPEPPGTPLEGSENPLFVNHFHRAKKPLLFGT